MQWLYDNPIYNLELLRGRRRAERNKWLLYLDPACYGLRIWAVIGIYFIISLLCCFSWTPVLLTFSVAIASAYAGASERLSGCLDMLLMTSVTPAQIMWGKAMARFIPALRLALVLFVAEMFRSDIIALILDEPVIAIVTPVAYPLSIGMMFHGSIVGTSLGFLLGSKRGNAHVAAALTAGLSLAAHFFHHLNIAYPGNIHNILTAKY